jgi:PBP1b-binding outer membrane lipoprotein LpoB
MKKLVLLCVFISGCAGVKNSVNTEAKTSYYPNNAQSIERIDFSIQMKKEW